MKDGARDGQARGARLEKEVKDERGTVGRA